MSTVQISATNLKTRMFAMPLWRLILAVTFGSFCFLGAQAQEGHSHIQTPAQKKNAGALIKTVREATARFKDVEEAKREHYALIFGCVTGDDVGAMGLHYLNGDLLDEVNKYGVFDPTRPQIVLYEPNPDGSLRLTGADYLVFADAWDAKHPNSPPELMGQLFHRFDTPNRFSLPAFYTLHVWAWKDNPYGAFVNWHPDVSCQAFGGENN